MLKKYSIGWKMNSIKDQNKMLQLRICGRDYDILKRHLYPGDNKEAIAFCLCGRLKNEHDEYLLVNEVVVIPHDACSVREDNLIRWPFTYLEDMLITAHKRKLSVLKIHSHPS